MAGDVAGFKIGDAVAVTGSQLRLEHLYVPFYMMYNILFTGVRAAFGAFAEYVCVPAKVAVPVPAARPEILSLMVSGLTASLALEEVGQMRKGGETVLVTGGKVPVYISGVMLAFINKLPFPGSTGGKSD
jgi:NADPH:quinone reductase-like Zn-dependent oxidoreductase